MKAALRMGASRRKPSRAAAPGPGTSRTRRGRRSDAQQVDAVLPELIQHPVLDQAQAAVLELRGATRRGCLRCRKVRELPQVELRLARPAAPRAQLVARSSVLGLGGAAPSLGRSALNIPPPTPRRRRHRSRSARASPSNTSGSVPSSAVPSADDLPDPRTHPAREYSGPSRRQPYQSSRVRVALRTTRRSRRTRSRGRGSGSSGRRCPGRTRDRSRGRSTGCASG